MTSPATGSGAAGAGAVEWWKRAARLLPAPVRRRIRRTVREPSDVPLAARMAWFIARCDRRLASRRLPDFVAELDAHRPATGMSVADAYPTIARVRGAVLRAPWLRRRNTCYVRALTLYRFLPSGEGTLGFHIGVEPSSGTRERLRGHAWVTLDGVLLEGPPEVVEDRVREIPLG